MAEGKPTEAQTHYARFPSLFRPDWLAVATAAQVRFGVGLWGGVLSTTAKQLQYQADYLKKLSEAEQPSDAVTSSREFVQKVASSVAAEGRQVFDRNVALIAASRQVG
jgi:hypothetical protein